MKLPNLEQANVPESKITSYLLNIEHEVGGDKAAFFIHFGFSVDRWDRLAEALVTHATQYEVVKQEETRFGTRYVVEGELETPSGRTPLVRSVWFVPRGAEQPRLTTAYPLEERHDQGT